MTTRTILLVDDDDDLRQILVEQLSLYEEFSLLQESNATRAMQTAKTAQEHGLRVDVLAEHSTPEGLVESLAAHGAQLRDSSEEADGSWRPSKRRLMARRKTT